MSHTTKNAVKGHSMQAKKQMDPKIFKGTFNSTRPGSAVSTGVNHNSSYRARQVDLMYILSLLKLYLE